MHDQRRNSNDELFPVDGSVDHEDTKAHAVNATATAAEPSLAAEAVVSKTPMKNYDKTLQQQQQFHLTPEMSAFDTSAMPGNIGSGAYLHRAGPLDLKFIDEAGASGLASATTVSNVYD